MVVAGVDVTPAEGALVALDPAAEIVTPDWVPVAVVVGVGEVCDATADAGAPGKRVCREGE